MITKFFQRIGFIYTITDTYILTIQWKGELIIIGVYVVDLILRSRSQEMLE